MSTAVVSHAPAPPPISAPPGRRHALPEHDGNESCVRTPLAERARRFVVGYLLLIAFGVLSTMSGASTENASAVPSAAPLLLIIPFPLILWGLHRRRPAHANPRPAAQQTGSRAGPGDPLLNTREES